MEQVFTVTGRMSFPNSVKVLNLGTQGTDANHEQTDGVSCSGGRKRRFDKYTSRRLRAADVIGARLSRAYSAALRNKTSAHEHSEQI